MYQGSLAPEPYSILLQPVSLPIVYNLSYNTTYPDTSLCSVFQDKNTKFDYYDHYIF